MEKEKSKLVKKSMAEIPEHIKPWMKFSGYEETDSQEVILSKLFKFMGKPEFEEYSDKLIKGYNEPNYVYGKLVPKTSKGLIGWTLGKLCKWELI